MADERDEGIEPSPIEDILGSPRPLVVPIRGAEPRGVTAQEVSRQVGDLEWLWDDWIPVGAVTLLVGEAGIGKSGIALALAGPVAHGGFGCAGILPNGFWPDGQRHLLEEEPAPVVWIDTEYKHAQAIQRMKCWGMNLARFRWPIHPDLPDVGMPGFRLDRLKDFEIVANYVRWHRPRLLVVDTLRGGHGGDENSSGMFEVISNLAGLASEMKMGVFVTHHLRKRGMNDPPTISMDRVRGSSAIVAAAASVIAVERLRAEDEVLWMGVLKSNFGEVPKPVGVSLGEMEVQFGKAPMLEKKETAVDRAVVFLETRLKKGAMKARDLQAEAEESGLGWSSVKKAKDRLKIVPKKDGRSSWMWGLPAI